MINGPPAPLFAFAFAFLVVIPQESAVASELGPEFTPGIKRPSTNGASTPGICTHSPSHNPRFPDNILWIMAKESSTRTCFVIAPIGKENSDVRLRSDQVLKHIIDPAANECGYKTLRADKISEPGLITSQVIQHVVDDPLVIADLTGWNPNVFYELSLRHALRKPVVQIIQANENIPFDISASRTIFVDHHDLDSVAKAKEEIVRQIHAVEKNPSDVDTPISVALELQFLRQSDNPLEKSNAEIISMLSDIRGSIVDLREEPKRMKLHPGVVEDLAMFLTQAYEVIDMDQPLDGPSKDRWDTLRSRIHRSERALRHLCMEAGLPPDFYMRRKRFDPKET